MTSSAAPTTFSAEGETITLTFVVQNSGSTYLCGNIEIVTDHDVGSKTFIANLFPNASQTFTTTYTTTAADVTAAAITFKSKAYICVTPQCTLATPFAASSTVTYSP